MRTARLKKHFDEVLFLDRETQLVDESVERWVAVFAALLAGMVAFAIQRSMALAAHFGAGLVVLAVVAGIAYALRDRIGKRFSARGSPGRSIGTTRSERRAGVSPSAVFPPATSSPARASGATRPRRPSPIR